MSQLPRSQGKEWPFPRLWLALYDLRRNTFSQETIQGYSESIFLLACSSNFADLRICNTCSIFLYRELLAPDGKLLEEGDILKRPLYADTLTKIGQSGSIYFYNSSFTEEMLADLKEYNSILTIEDFLGYTALEKEAIVSEFAGLKVLGVPPPSSGAVLALILNILEGNDCVVWYTVKLRDCS